jgi:hypothetical protein
MTVFVFTDPEKSPNSAKAVTTLVVLARSRNRIGGWLT